MHFVPIWPSSGWWQRRDMKDCISWLRPWRRAGGAGASNARFACQAIVAQLSAVQTQIKGSTNASSCPSRQCRQQTTRSHSRVRPDPVYSPDCNDDRPKGVQDRPRVCRLDRIGAAAELLRWEGTPWLDFQAGRSLPATTIGPRCNIHCRDRMHGPDNYPWVTDLLGRRPAKVVAVALANKIARTAWAMLARVRPIGHRYA